MIFISRLCFIVFLCASPLAMRAQNIIIGKRINDAIMQLGTEYTRTEDGQITKLKYAPITIDHPGFGRFKETNQYDFVNGVCEARHTFVPLTYLQAYTDDLNDQFGHGDHLWHGDNDTYIAIKEHTDNFELIVWTPVYEEILDNR